MTQSKRIGAGRPLQASETQRQAALRLHKAGVSLRAICREVSISLRTVRTIVEKAAKGLGR